MWSHFAMKWNYYRMKKKVFFEEKIAYQQIELNRPLARQTRGDAASWHSTLRIRHHYIDPKKFEFKQYIYALPWELRRFATFPGFLPLVSSVECPRFLWSCVSTFNVRAQSTKFTVCWNRQLSTSNLQSERLTQKALKSKKSIGHHTLFSSWLFVNYLIFYFLC